METDIVFSDQGSVIVFTPVTEAGTQWFEENVAWESWNQVGPSIVADHRPARAILEGLLDAGLRVARA